MDYTQVIIAVEQDPAGRDLNIGFMMAPRHQPLEAKLAHAQRAVDTGQYHHWNANRRKFVDRVLALGHKVVFRLFRQIPLASGGGQPTVVLG